jgi:Cof subfamily protein (haloacid dehalogenase superfamily)
MNTSRPKRSAQSRDLALVISDVDGTLINPDRRLTLRAITAVARLADVGIGFTLISSRPPQGLSALVAALNVRLPFAAFSGGNLLAPDMSLLEARHLSPETARQILVLLAARGVDPWVFTDEDWRLRNARAPHVAAERGASGLDPMVVDDFECVIARVDKIVGVSDDLPLLARLESEARVRLGQTATVQRSHPYYLDVTRADANKGDGVEALCRRIGVELRHTAVIGDMFNDISMFARAGFSIAMGQAPSEVKAAADTVTGSNAEDGFASAVEQLIRAHGARTEA